MGKRLVTQKDAENDISQNALTAWEAAQKRELKQMQERTEKLDALLIYFAQRLDKPQNISNLSHSELYDYSCLIQEQINAVLAYEEVAWQWPELEKKRAKELIDKAIISHQHLKEVLEGQCKLLAQRLENARIDKTDISHKNSIYRDSLNAGRMFDLQG